jgi:hypothetical protein
MSDLDADGYPTSEAEEKIRTWPYSDPAGLLAYVKDLWMYPEHWNEVPHPGQIAHRISTCGWSGNEQLIAAMQANTVFWALAWYSSRRGGHYEFRVRGPA